MPSWRSASGRTPIAVAVALVLLAGCGSSVGLQARAAAPPVEPAGDYVWGSAAPALGARNGWALWVVAGGTLVVTELDDGHIRARPIGPADRAGVLLASRSGAFVSGYPDPSSSTFVDRALATLTPAPRRRLSFRGADLPWSLDVGGDGFQLTALRQDGSVGTSRHIEPSGTGAWPFFDFEPAGVVGDELVLDARGRIVLVRATDGASRLYAEGEVLAVGGDRIVWRDCSAFDACVAFAGTRDEPRSVKLGFSFERPSCTLTEGAEPAFCPVAVSADGSVLVVGASNDAVRLVDLRTGAEQRLGWPTSRLEPRINTGEAFGVGGIALSPDGTWLFGVQTNGRITAVEWATGRSVQFDVIRPLDKAEGVVTAFAVG